MKKKLSCLVEYFAINSNIYLDIELGEAKECKEDLIKPQSLNALIM